MKTGIERINEERGRQISGEGWTPENDDGYVHRELMHAAHCYANGHTTVNGVMQWPWSRSWWKPSDDPVRNYEKAGALYLAERDRLKRSGFIPTATDGDLVSLMECKAAEMADRIDEILENSK